MIDKNREREIRISVLEGMHKDLHDQCEKNPTTELKKRKLEVKTELQKLKNYLTDKKQLTIFQRQKINLVF